jgi:alpha-galactosidase
LQYGEFSRIDYPKDNKVQWQVREKDGSKAITGFFQTLAKASEGYDYLRVLGLKADTQYRLETKPQSIYVKRFGGLVKHLLPVELNPDGLVLRTANKYYTMKDCVESYEGDGAMLASGVMLNNQYMGTGYNENIRLLGDFGSNLYMITQSTTK